MSTEPEGTLMGPLLRPKLCPQAMSSELAEGGWLGDSSSSILKGRARAPSTLASQSASCSEWMSIYICIDLLTGLLYSRRGGSSKYFQIFTIFGIAKLLTPVIFAGIGDRSLRLLRLKEMLTGLPRVNFEVLKFIFQHFVRWVPIL